MKFVLTCAAALLVSAAHVSAATMSFDVHANDNVWNGGRGGDNILNGDPGLATGINLSLGQEFSVAVDDVDDTWNFCVSGSLANCEVDADGRRVLGSNTPLGNYSHSGATFSFGTLVGRVGSGDFFAVGTAGFSGPSNADGELRLYHWDHNNNNGGTISATVTYTMPSAVPLPASLPLLLGAFGVVGLARRRKNAK